MVLRSLHVVDRGVARPKGSTTKPSPAAVAARRRLGVSIRDARVALGWTLEDLAQEAGVEAAQIARLEAGQTNVTFHVLHRIAEGLHLVIALFPASGRRKEEKGAKA